MNFLLNGAELTVHVRNQPLQDLPSSPGGVAWAHLVVGTLGWREEQEPGIEAKRWHFWVYSGSCTKQGSCAPALWKQRPIDKCIQECLSPGVGQVTVMTVTGDSNANSTAKRPFLFHKHCKMLTAQDVFDKWSLGIW